MRTQKEIEEAKKEYLERLNKLSPEEYIGPEDSFEHGIEWADKNSPFRWHKLSEHDFPKVPRDWKFILVAVRLSEYDIPMIMYFSPVAGFCTMSSFYTEFIIDPENIDSWTYLPE